VHIGGVQSLVTSLDFKFDLLAFSKCFKAVHRDRREVNEDVLSTLLLDEAIPFGVIELLYFSPGHGAAFGI